MFIVVIGTKASGKEAVAKQLVQALGFTRLYLDADSQVDDDTDGKTTFNSAKDILKFVTPRWRTNYVTTNVTTPVDLYLVWKRPFVLVVGIDAPVSLRYKRHCIRAVSKEAPLTLEEFVEADDNLLYTCQDPPPIACSTADLSTSLASIGMNNSMETSLKAVAHLNTHKSPLSPIIPQTAEKHNLNLKRVLSSANVTITNTFATVEDLYEYMDKIDLTNGERLRPSWDTYFMLLSELASHRSNCMKRRVGCILVKDNQIIATGYNGTPKGVTNCNEGGCPRCNAGTPCGVSLDHCLCIHAEENALLEAGRGRVRSAADVVLYCNTCPCLGCAKKIVQVGVKVVVYSKGYGMDDLTLKLFSEAKVIIRQHTPPTLSMDIGSP
ncbi:Deoxycytidine monophosphate (dCMP) deaminase [Coemansia sp. RSA 1822]|nr:Deoxycytidine monophosphate (dCMP) deaminase [Coemansia sp. RSA 638]KAJ2539610.1 Deoxycytidine monophosphate (dCMP) deaminase [Coemansia sp. RSA 1853]KAJ2567019.1 Deoxycytidine monophosphate (dCMP) deaminase [Coemansia sp. RSA 1822]